MIDINRLKQLRIEKGIKKGRLSEILGLEKSTYGKYESGARSPNVETLIRLADYFNVSTDYLLGRADIRHIMPAVNDKTKESAVTSEFESYKEYIRRKYKLNQ